MHNGVNGNEIVETMVRLVAGHLFGGASSVWFRQIRIRIREPGIVNTKLASAGIIVIW